MAVAAARAVEFGFDTLACASTGNLAGATAAAAAAAGLRAFVFVPSDLEPAKIDHALSLRRDGRPGRRHVRRHQPALPRDRRRGGLGVRQRQPPAVLRRGQQDARLRDRRAARLAAARRRRRPDRVRVAVHEGRQGLRRAGRRSAWSSARTSGSSAASRRAARRSPRRSRTAARRSAVREPDTIVRSLVDRLARRRRLRDRAGAADRRVDRGGRGRDTAAVIRRVGGDRGDLRRDRRRRDGRGGRAGPGARGSSATATRSSRC